MRIIYHTHYRYVNPFWVFLCYNFLMEFSERLKAIRIECGLTQRNVYSKLNVSANCYASYEQGRTEPNIEMLKQLCRIFNVSSDYLIGLEDEHGNKIQITNSFNNNSGKIDFKA